MDTVIIDRKETEYASQFEFEAAFHLGNYEKARKSALKVLIMHRLQARKAHDKTESVWAEVRGLRRGLAKMKAEGVKFPIGEQRVKKLEDKAEAAEKESAAIGEQIHFMLELWQIVGATFDDLCNLCNRDPVQVKKEIGDEWLNESFSKLVTCCNLDYKNPRDTGKLEDYVDAPMTHALKAYVIDNILHTEIGKAAAHVAFEKFFLELIWKWKSPPWTERGTGRRMTATYRSNNIAADIKRIIPARIAAERYGFTPNRAGYICCPFHMEKTGSLKFFNDSGWHCFGCGKGGSNIDFVMELFDINFRQAVLRLDMDFSLNLIGEKPVRLPAHAGGIRYAGQGQRTENHRFPPEAQSVPSGTEKSRQDGFAG